MIAGAGLTVNVDAENGTFLGSLADRNSLMPQKLYTLRVQQRDSDANWSPWSNWSTSLQTGSQIAPNLDCDFDTNSSCDVTDLNSLLVALGGGDLRFDLDGSGTVDLNDRDEWLTSAGMDNIGVPFVVGDADLN